MNQLITPEQGRAILGGREPFGIVEYEQAVALLRQCMTIDDAKRFATFADAKAAWAKIVHDETALRLCRALKLHAAKRMAEQAYQDRPPLHKPGGKGRFPGHVALLKAHGMTEGEAAGASKLARMSKREFQSLVDARRPPALSMVVHKNEGWRHMSLKISSFRCAIASYTPEQAVAMIGTNTSTRVDRAEIRKRLTEIYEWCDEFLQRLPKD